MSQYCFIYIPSAIIYHVRYLYGSKVQSIKVISEHLASTLSFYSLLFSQQRTYLFRLLFYLLFKNISQYFSTF